MTYSAPEKEILFVLETVAETPALANFPAFEECDPDLVAAIISEAGRFTSEVLAPLNVVGDREGAKLIDGEVKAAPGFADAYRQYVEGGWNGLASDPEYGGQGLPHVLSLAVEECVQSANMAFALCPMLTRSAIEAIGAHGTDEQKATYLEKITTGEWTGSMQLTEPQAGSDVGALKSRAEPQPDGSYKIKGTKIFITWGEHDVAENIVHLVLARTPNSPAGTKGISLFIVPKFLVNEDGSLGRRNDVTCASLEHKLGIHASPTCVLTYGDNDDCTGYLIGEEHRGMACMFTMMNSARVAVGVQGMAIAEAAYQHAAQFAADRVQGSRIDDPERKPVPIIAHADVRRNLMTMRALTEASRAICYLTGVSLDRAHASDDADERARNAGLADLLTPIAKAFSTDVGVEVSSLGIQVHGGMGYVEETGAAQYYRDARIATIYEGTNGIQALDLVGRKLNMAGGAHWRAFLSEIRNFAGALADDGDQGTMKAGLAEGVDAVENAANFLVGNGSEKILDTAAGATPSCD